MKGQNSFWRMFFLACNRSFLRSNTLEQMYFKLEKMVGGLGTLQEKLEKSVFYGNHKLHCPLTSEPVLLMWDVKAEDLKLLLDFMYQGQVNVAHENLNSFLALAERLQVRGLTSNIASNNSHRTTTNSLHSMDLFCPFSFFFVKT